MVGYDSSLLKHSKHTRRANGAMELATGIEPATCALQVRCSTVEPRQQIAGKNPALPTIRISIDCAGNMH